MTIEIVDFPIKHNDFPQLLYVKLLEGKNGELNVKNQPLVMSQKSQTSYLKPWPGRKTFSEFPQL